MRVEKRGFSGLDGSAAAAAAGDIQSFFCVSLAFISEAAAAAFSAFILLCTIFSFPFSAVKIAGGGMRITSSSFSFYYIK